MNEQSFAVRRGLAVGQVDVWLAASDEISADDLRSYERLMSPDEHARWTRFVVPKPRLQHLVARALLRRTLSRYAEVAPRQWQFDANTYGRPHIAGPTPACDLRFNISHTDGLVAVAVAKGLEIGVDVENVARSLDVLQLAPSVFAPAEVAALELAAERDRADVFFSFWTLKEAYIKARGMGLSLKLDGFAFDLSGTHPRISFNDRCPDDPSRWQFRRYLPTATHALAVAVSAPENAIDVRLIWVVPDAQPDASP
ncbi:4'-phosphopantetheinyl transferase family protein [Bradyrhizobium sp.]|jgi:4'-phosphopantetheinyl transferase|uniref:4'-phosphopantetheinyl transferase family protein n=1 Tax=Bradyrhizobium sp. TaxID=376 RepID=UPI002DFF6964|nr:4'-phosphopantetheinyl transferase superfamily protein [Bradyrhizobium sp.]